MEGTLTVKGWHLRDASPAARRAPRSSRRGQRADPLAARPQLERRRACDRAISIVTRVPRRIVTSGLRTCVAVEHRRERAQELGARHVADHAHVEQRRRRSRRRARSSSRSRSCACSPTATSHASISSTSSSTVTRTRRRPVRRAACAAPRARRAACRSPTSTVFAQRFASASKPALATVVNHAVRAVGGRRRGRGRRAPTRAVREQSRRRRPGRRAGSRGGARSRCPSRSGTIASTPSCSAASPASSLTVPSPPHATTPRSVVERGARRSRAASATSAETCDVDVERRAARARPRLRGRACAARPRPAAGLITAVQRSDCRSVRRSVIGAQVACGPCPTTSRRPRPAADPRTRRDRDGRQRPVGEAPGPEAHRRPRGGGGGAVRHGRRRARRSACSG